jgi:hypothetical protein
MNSNGLDEYIVDKCYSQAQQTRKLHIPITVHDRKRSVFAAICQQIYGSQSRKAFTPDWKDWVRWSLNYETDRKRELNK